MSRPFDYSKWDRLEISDDEKDAHPNIDSSLMIRIKREQRARREAEEEMKKAQLRKIGTPEALRQIEEIDMKSKLHVDNICRVVDQKTIINKPAKNEPVKDVVAKPVSALSNTTSGEEENEDLHSEEAEFEAYVSAHESSLSEYAQLVTLEESEEFLTDNVKLISEHACGWMLLQMLSLEMEGERKLMLNATRQYLMLRNIVDLTRESKRGNDAVHFVKLFFKQISGDKDRREMLDRETENFAQQIISRAIQKRQEEQGNQ
jgi:cell division cycle protein 37